MAGPADLASATPYGAAAKVLGDALGSGGGPSSAQSGTGAITGPTINLGSQWTTTKVAAAGIAALAAIALAALAVKARKG